MRGLARAAGVDVAYVSRIESATYDLPNPLYLQAISDALDISTVELFLAAGYLRLQDMKHGGVGSRATRTARPTPGASEPTS